MQMGQGQFCVCPNVIVLADHAEALSASLISATNQHQAAHAAPGIAQAHQAGIQTLNSNLALSDWLAHRPLRWPGASPSMRPPICSTIRTSGKNGLAPRRLSSLPIRRTNSLPSPNRSGFFNRYHTWPRCIRQRLITILSHRAGRLVWNVPTGSKLVMPPCMADPSATTDSRVTSVGTTSISRFLRRVSFQPFPELLPDALRD